MKYYGTFAPTRGAVTYQVYIQINNGDSTEREIGTETDLSSDDGIVFSSDAVTITDEAQDSFDVLRCKSATIRLYCRQHHPEFFQADCKNAVVSIYQISKAGSVTPIFYGYISPMSFSQPWAEKWDSVELECIDHLSALQYSNYADIAMLNGPTYNSIKEGANMKTFATLIKSMLNVNLDVKRGESSLILYDGSKSIQGSSMNIFDTLKISELLFLGDKVDDVWTKQDVLTEILKYLRLHIQQGFYQNSHCYYIYDNESISGSLITWKSLDSATTGSSSCLPVTLVGDILAGNDANISQEEIYSQLKVTANITKNEDLIESPLDNDQLHSPFANKQKYLQESWVDMNAYTEPRKYTAARDILINGYQLNTVGWTTTMHARHLIQIFKAKNWLFNAKKYGEARQSDIYSVYECDKGLNQQAMLKGVSSGLSALIYKHSSISYPATLALDLPFTPKSDGDTILHIGCHGSECALPSELKAAIPLAEYKSNVSGGAFSPTDADTTNYIVISGSVRLQKKIDPVNSKQTLKEKAVAATAESFQRGLNGDIYPKTQGGGDLEQDFIDALGQNATSDFKINNGDEDTSNGMYFREWLSYDKPNGTMTRDLTEDNPGIYPVVGLGDPVGSLVCTSAKMGDVDLITHIPVLQCMLIIGDKCLTQTVTSDGISRSWVTYKERAECASDDEYYAQSFTLTMYIDITKDDKNLLSAEFRKFSSNIVDDLNIEAKDGLAIPIKMTDQLYGKVTFKILGPVNLVYSTRGKSVTCLTPFYNIGSTSSQLLPVLSMLSAIQVKNFEIKLYSDNAKVNNYEDKDIVYASDEACTYKNIKDDIEMKINSSLTSEECQKMGVSNVVAMSNPVNVNTGLGLLTITNNLTNETAKAEQHYIDAYWREYHSPHRVLQLTVKHESAHAFRKYKHPVDNSIYRVQAAEDNLAEGTTVLTLKEIKND